MTACLNFLLVYATRFFTLHHDYRTSQLFETASNFGHCREVPATKLLPVVVKQAYCSSTDEAARSLSRVELTPVKRGSPTPQHPSPAKPARAHDIADVGASKPTACK